MEFIYLLQEKIAYSALQLEPHVVEHPLLFSLLFLLTISSGVNGLLFGSPRIASFVGATLLLFASLVIGMSLIDNQEIVKEAFTSLSDKIGSPF